MANSGMVAITVALIGAGATVATAYIANQGKDEKAPAPLATVPPAQQPAPQTAPQTVQQPAAPTAAPAPLSDGATRALEAVAAASSAPATTPPPASNPGNQFDVAGQWHTPDHSPVVATQEGGTFAIATVPVGIGAYGTGRIMGNQLAWDYVSVPSQTTGRCTGSIAPDGQTIASTCYDSSGASYPYELHRPGAR